MQLILGIDFSVQPCELCLVRAEGERLHVAARQTVAIDLLSNLSVLASQELAATFASLRKSGSEQEKPAAEQSPEEVALTERTVQAIDALKESLRSLGGEWTSSVVIMPTSDHLSLNVNLPFSDTKMLDQVIDLEVQDVVPFELDGFSVQHCALGQFYRSEGNAALADPSAAYDIHVGIMPRTLVSNVLTLCKSVGIEPNILTVPSSALASIYHLGKNFFSGNSAIILCRNDEYALAAHINGQVRVEKTIRDGTILQAASGSGTSSDKRAVYTAIKLLIAAAERRYGSSIDKLFFLDADTPDAALQQILGRPLEALSSAEFLAPGSKGSGLAALSAVFARDDEPAAALSNFRAREFSFTPTLTEFFRALLGAKRQVVNAVVSVLVCVAGVYLAREYNITESRSALIEQVRAVIPDFNPGEGDIRAALIRAETKLSEDLGVLGPIAKVTPLDALLEIIRVLPTDGITITSVKVTGTRAFIQGTAPKLGAIEAVGDALRGSKEFFSKVTASPGTSVGSRFNFSIEVVLGQ